MNSYIVAIRETEGDGKMYSLLLNKKDLAYLLLHIDEDMYEVGEIINTYSEKEDDFLHFCEITKNLETGGKEEVE